MTLSRGADLGSDLLDAPNMDHLIERIPVTVPIDALNALAHGERHGLTCSLEREEALRALVAGILGLVHELGKRQSGSPVADVRLHSKRGDERQHA